jgi:hypothetical protein
MSLKEFLGLTNNKKNINVLNNLYKKPKKDVGVNMPRFQTDLAENNVQQADLLFLPDDDGFKYALVVVDQGSRLCDAEPLKSKETKNVLNAFKNIYKRAIIKLPKRLEVDAGTEFKKGVLKYFNDNNCFVRIAKPGRHRQQALVERKNQEIGKIIFKRQVAQELLTGDHSVEWAEDLPKIVEILNKIAKKRKPKRLNDDPVCQGDSCNLLSIGTKVRLQLDNPQGVLENKLHGKFRSTDIKFSPKIRIITDLLLKPGFPPMYCLDNDRSVSYTKNQLQIALDNEKYPNNTVIRGKPKSYIVQKIISKKKMKNKLYYEILWRGFKETTWEPASEIKKDVPHIVKTFEDNLKINK